MEFMVWEHAPGRRACSLGRLRGVEDVTGIKRGRPAHAAFPADARFEMRADRPKDTKLEDVLNNTDRLVVASPALAAFLRAQDLADLELLPMGIQAHDGSRAADYQVVHPCAVVDRIDHDASNLAWNTLDPELVSGVYALEIDTDRIPDGTRIFRAQHLEMCVFVRDDLAEALEEEGFTGSEFTPADEFSY